MPDGSSDCTLTLHPRIADIAPADWDACAGAGNPFVSHAFLSALEDSGSAGPRTGWLPQHAALRDGAAGCSRFPRTKIFPSRCSTIQLASALNAGARKASPVRRSKQA